MLKRQLQGDAKKRESSVYELLNDFHYKELDKLSETTRRVERDFVQLITDNGGHIKKYDSFEQFESAKL